MRSFVFRVLAGLLAIAFAWVLLSGNFAGRPFRQLVMFWLITVVFGIFAMFGTYPAEKLLTAFHGVPHPEDKNDQEKENADEQA